MAANCVGDVSALFFSSGPTPVIQQLQCHVLTVTHTFL